MIAEITNLIRDLFNKDPLLLIVLVSTVSALLPTIIVAITTYSFITNLSKNYSAITKVIYRLDQILSDNSDDIEDVAESLNAAVTRLNDILAKIETGVKMINLKSDSIVGTIDDIKVNIAIISTKLRLTNLVKWSDTDEDKGNENN